MASKVFKTKVIAYKKEDYFLAIALDFDLMAQGKSMGQVLDRLDDCIKSYLIMCIEDKENDKEIYRKAPKKYFGLYNLFLDLEKQKQEKRQAKFKSQFLGTISFNKSTLAHV